MEYVFFKDILFELINECDQFDIRDLVCKDGGDRMILLTEDGKRFELCLRDMTCIE